MRIKRHDAIANYIAAKLNRAEFHVESELKFNTEEGMRKPDITATLGRTTFVIDIGITSDRTDLEKVNREKVRKYGNNASLIELIKTKYKSSGVITLAAILNCRGVWCRTSADQLLLRGLISQQDIKIISSRVVIKGIAQWNFFNKATTMKRVKVQRRTGIG